MVKNAVFVTILQPKVTYDNEFLTVGGQEKYFCQHLDLNLSQQDLQKIESWLTHFYGQN